VSSARHEILPRPVDGVHAVQRAAEGGREREGLHALDRNERLEPLPEAIVQELRAAVTSELLTTYPTVDRLYDDVAAALGVPRERILLTPGSDAGVRALHAAYVRPGDTTLSMDPSYAMYQVYGRLFAAEPRTVVFSAGPDGPQIDDSALLEAIDAGPRVVLLANPNQPTGTMLAPELLREAIERAARVGALVLVDEAYHPFTDFTVLPWVAEHPNLLVSRTYSKAWGLAGLRAGVVVADPEVRAQLYKVRSVYDMTALSATALAIVLRHPEVATDYVAAVGAGRALLAGRARALGLRPLESPTNFLVIDLQGRDDPERLAAALSQRGWLIKAPFSHPSLVGCIRVTLGGPELMERFADVLQEVLA
jgi:histidinol-phosphate aminotransferase